MTKWTTLTINLTKEQSRQLKALAGLKGMSQSEFFKYLLNLHLSLNKDILRFIDGFEGKSPTEPPKSP